LLAPTHAVVPVAASEADHHFLKGVAGRLTCCGRGPAARCHLSPAPLAVPLAVLAPADLGPQNSAPAGLVPFSPSTCCGDRASAAAAHRTPSAGHLGGRSSAEQVCRHACLFIKLMVAMLTLTAPRRTMNAGSASRACIAELASTCALCSEPVTIIYVLTRAVVHARS